VPRVFSFAHVATKKLVELRTETVLSAKTKPPEIQQMFFGCSSTITIVSIKSRGETAKNLFECKAES